ncbi:MAG: ABC transporter substrate-binding protein, partial [[Eubacterium] rectale]|nr:ABC transporter substrate-binding protein [Agathobacter rectalis]
NHRYGLCFTWDIANIDNNTDYVMLPALTGPDGVRNITRQNNSETSGFDRGRCVLTSSCRDTALAAAWIDQMYAPIQSPQNNWGTYGEKDSFNIFEMSTNDEGGQMLKHMDLGDQDNMHEAYLKDMNSKYVYPNVFMSIDDTNKVSQYDTDIKKYAEQKKADWILNGGIDKEWDSYLKKLDKYGLQDYLKIKQKYFDSYQKSLESTSEGK